MNTVALVEQLGPVSRGSTSVQVRASDPVLQAGVETALRGRREITVAGGTAPDVVVVVVDAVDDDVLALLRGARPGCRRGTLLVATAVDATGTLRAIEAGVGGVLRRREATSDGLGAAVLAVANGHGALPPDLLGEILDRLGRPDTHPVTVLDEREKAVLRMVADGLETTEVAHALAYSARTVTGIMHDITRRLRLRNRAHAVAYALRKGLI